MSKFVKIEPIVYRVIKKKDSKHGYDLLEVAKDYSVIDKLYGPVHKILQRLEVQISRRLMNNISILNTGAKGMGKTTTANKICNLLLAKGFPVIEVKYIEIDTNLIAFLSNLRNCVIYIDEFAKYFNPRDQDKAITLFNKNKEYFNVYILNENNIDRINEFITDRMERIRYHTRHDRISKEDLEIYMKDREVDQSIINALIDINEKSSSISYDTLEVIAEEHKIFPELSFSELTELLNCQGIIGIPVMKVLEVQIDNTEMYVQSFDLKGWSAKLRKDEFMEKGYELSIDISVIKAKTLTATPEGVPAMPERPMNHTLRVGADKIKRINDMDGVITLETKFAGSTYTILLDTKLMPSSALR